MILGALVFFSAVVCGMLAVRALDPEKRLYFGERIISLVVSGLTGFGFLILALSAAAGNLSAGIWGAVLASVFLAAAFRAQLTREFTIFRDGFRRAFCTAPSLARVVLAALLLIYLAVVLNVMIRSADGTPQGVLKGWGDVAYHLNIIEFLATVSPFRLEQPIAGGEPLTYPFFVDFWSAIFRKVGLSVFGAWHIPVILFGISLFFLVFYFGKRMLERDSLALMLVILTFFGGGIGFLWFFQDVSNAWQASGMSGAGDMLLNLPHEYTHLDIRTGGKPSYMDEPLNIVWIVPAISFFSHQRSFVAGSAIGLLMLLGVFLYWYEPKVMWRWLALAGFLPFSHTHTFLALAAITLPILFLTQMRNWRWWILGGSLALVIALPQIYLLASGEALGEGFGHTFFKPWFGWMAEENVFWFWTKNFGIVFWGWIVVVLGLLIRFARALRNRMSSQVPDFFPGLAIASVAIFAISHLVKFQPWEFDNNKVIFYWWFFASVILLAGLGTLMFHISRKWLAGALIVFVVAVGSFAGFLDVFGRVSGQKEHYGYYGAAEIEAAKWIRENTLPGDIILTIDSANAFVPMLSGRAIYLGFPGWVWTQGKQSLIGERKQKINEFLLFGDASGICADGVRYVVWDAGFISSYPYANIDKVRHLLEPEFQQNTPYGERTIYRILCENF